MGATQKRLLVKSADSIGVSSLIAAFGLVFSGRWCNNGAVPIQVEYRLN
jgi:hypothetical protein